MSMRSTDRWMIDRFLEILMYLDLHDEREYLENMELIETEN